MLRTHCQTSGRVADRAGSVQQRHPHHDRGDGGDARRHAVAPHQRARRGDRAADRFLRPDRAQHADRDPGRDRDDQGRRSARRLLLCRGADRRSWSTRRWEIIERVEAEGGMAKAVAAGWPKAMIEEAAAARAGAGRPRRGRDRRRQQIPAGRGGRRSTSSTSTTTRCARRRSRGSSRCKAGARRGGVPGGARRAARGRARAAATCSRSRSRRARARATLGEIAAAMEDVFGRYGTQPTPVKGVYGGAYDDDARWAQAGRRRRRDRAPPGPQAAHAGRQDGAGRPRSRRQSRRLGVRRSGLRGRRRAAVPDARGSRRAGARAAMSTWSAPPASRPGTRR